MLTRWTCSVPGIATSTGKGRLTVFALPASLLYFKHIQINHIHDIRRHAAGVIDPDLPVAVEDCHLHCAVRGCEAALFAIESRSLANAISEYAQDFHCDCVVPLPLAVWDFASDKCFSAQGSSALVVLHASCSGWSIMTGYSGRRGTTVPIAMATVPTGDLAAATRTARILASRIASPRVFTVIGSCDDNALGSISAAIGSKPLSVSAPSDSVLLSHYMQHCYFKKDFPIIEVESARIQRRRSIRFAIPFAALFAASIAFVCVSYIHASNAAHILHRDNSALRVATAKLAGFNIPQSGFAAASTAQRAFYERAVPAILDSLVPSPASILQYTLSFAEARSIILSSIDCDGRNISIILRPEQASDLDTLTHNLADSGSHATLSVLDDGRFRLDIPMETIP